MDYQNAITSEKVNLVLENKKQFSSEATNYYSEGWKMLQERMGPYLGFIALLLGLFIGIGVLSFITSDFMDPARLSQPPTPNPVLSIFMSLGTSFLSPIIMGGIYIYIYKHKFNFNPNFNDFFGGFKHASFLGGHGLLVFILVTFMNLPILLLSGIPFGLTLFSGEGLNLLIQDGKVIPAIFIYMISIFTYLIWGFTSLFILFANMGIWESMESSRKMVFNNIGTVIVVFILGVLLALASIFTCGIGLLWAMPLIYIVNSLLFFDLFDMQTDGDETDDIIQHLV